MWTSDMSPALALSAFAALMLTGCSADASFEDRLRESAASATPFTLPETVDGDLVWEELLVLCPYDDTPEGVHAAFIEEAATINVDSAEGSQWLLFRAGDEVTTLAMSRSNVDLCAVASGSGMTFGPEIEWRSEHADGAVVLTPIAGAAA